MNPYLVLSCVKDFDSTFTAVVLYLIYKSYTVYLKKKTI